MITNILVAASIKMPLSGTDLRPSVVNRLTRTTRSCLLRSPETPQRSSHPASLVLPAQEARRLRVAGYPMADLSTDTPMAAVTSTAAPTALAACRVAETTRLTATCRAQMALSLSSSPLRSQVERASKPPDLARLTLMRPGSCVSRTFTPPILTTTTHSARSKDW
jgi:hypothetical protein